MKLDDWIYILSKIFQTRINAAQAGDLQHRHRVRTLLVLLYSIFAISLYFILAISLASIAGETTTSLIIGYIIIILFIIISGIVYFYKCSYGKKSPRQIEYLKESLRELSKWFITLESKTHLTESDYIEMEKIIEALKNDKYVKLSNDEAKKLMFAFEMIKEYRRPVTDKLELYAPIEPAINTVTQISNIEEIGKYAECPYCGSNIRDTFYELGGIVRCDKCGAFHHRECFEFYGGKCGSPTCKL